MRMQAVGGILLVIVALAGCGTGPTKATNVPPTPPPVVLTEPPASPQTPPSTPPVPSKPEVRVVGQDLEITGLENVPWVVWSPSGRFAVIPSKSESYLLDVEKLSLRPLPNLVASTAPAFWSETEVLWMVDGRLQVRDLVSGDDRLLHDFGTPVIHTLRPGDTHFVANRQNGMPRQGYRFGRIVTGGLGDPNETVLFEDGYLIGPMRDGQVLAMAGSDPGGHLWSITPEGGKRLLGDATAHFAKISSDGRRALWLTGPSPSGDLHDLPLTDLWTWDGTGAPVRISLGRTFSARAEFSPDGSRIALSLNEDFLGSKAAPKPGRLVVSEGGELRTIGTFDGWVGLGMWLGEDGFQFMPPALEKTGAQAPIMRIDLTGKQEEFTGGLWHQAGAWDQGGTLAFKRLILDWRGDLTTVHWFDSTEVARVNYNPNQHPGNLLYVPPSGSYLPFSNSDGLWLKRLER